MLLPSVNNSLNDLVGLLGQLSNAEYSKPVAALSNATIGEHTRHIVEMFQCLLGNYESGIVNYDKRERNIMIQTDTDFALAAINNVKLNLNRPDKKLVLRQVVDGEEVAIDSNYNRELLYNLEHCIHHQALIKVAVLQCEDVVIADHFGVARSTIEYRSQCAQ
jgi:hypothetical protein